MEFIKMHGLGNDFIITMKRTWEEAEGLRPHIEKLCHRNFGIGADGVVVAGPDPEADLFMRIFNPDGSEAEMCGNAIRCVAGFAYTEKLSSKKVIAVKTMSGLRFPEIISGEPGKPYLVRVDMGKPAMDPALIPVNSSDSRDIKISAVGQEFTLTAVSMGNPHAVIFVEDIAVVPLRRWGPAIEQHQIFPAKTNVEFVQVINPGELEVKVWERGAGATLACGTGACAVLAAAVSKDLADREAVIRLPGGELLVTWSPGDGNIYMTGPAQEVFRGFVPLEQLWEKI